MESRDFQLLFVIAERRVGRQRQSAFRDFSGCVGHVDRRRLPRESPLVRSHLDSAFAIETAVCIPSHTP